jgi:hypothetical protein
VARRVLRAPGSRAAGGQRTLDVQAIAEIHDLYAQEAAEAPTEAILGALRSVREQLAAIEHHLLGQAHPADEPNELPVALIDDSVVDQNSVPAPRALYLRLARERRFPSNKIGKKVLARWGDVRTAFLTGPGPKNASSVQESPADGLDALRLQLGLAPKGK